MAQPMEPFVLLPLVEPDNGENYSGDPAPDIWSHDWVPDGTQIVYSDRFRREW